MSSLQLLRWLAHDTCAEEHGGTSAFIQQFAALLGCGGVSDDHDDAEDGRVRVGWVLVTPGYGVQLPGFIRRARGDLVARAREEQVTGNGLQPRGAGGEEYPRRRQQGIDGSLARMSQPEERGYNWAGICMVVDAIKSVGPGILHCEVYDLEGEQCPAFEFS